MVTVTAAALKRTAREEKRRAGSPRTADKIIGQATGFEGQTIRISAAGVTSADGNARPLHNYRY